MRTEQWIVKKPSGEEWGLIKRLVLDSATRQITYADVIIGETGRLVRVPWKSFELQNDWFTLGEPERKESATTTNVSLRRLPETLTMEVWP